MIDETLVYDCHCGWQGLGSDLARQEDYGYDDGTWVDCSNYFCPICSSDSITEQDQMLDDEANEYNEIRCQQCNGQGKVPVINHKGDYVGRDVCRKCSGLGKVRLYTGYSVDSEGNRHKVDSK